MNRLLIYLGMFLVLGISAQAKAQPTEQALARAKQLKAGIKTFRLGLYYNGDEDKPFYRLTLKVGAVEQSGPFQRLVSITEEQATKIIDHLATEGFLDEAFDLRAKTKQPPPTSPGYVMMASIQGIGFQQDLGWGLPMLKRLDGLRTVLDGDAAKEMDFLLGRLTGLRKEWEKAGIGNWKKLYEDEPWYKDHKQPEGVFTGTLQRHKEPEFSTLMRSHRYKLGDRFLYPGQKNDELERLIGKTVEIRGKPYDVELEGQSVREIWPGAIRAAGSTPPEAQPPGTTQSGPERRQEGLKIVTEFPKAIHGFHGRLLGIISAINKSGIVLTDISAVEKEYPPERPGDLPYTMAVAKDAPEAWLLGKNVQLLCKDDKYKKNYGVGQVIRGVVQWSDEQKGLVIVGAQWTGARTPSSE